VTRRAGVARIEIAIGRLSEPLPKEKKTRRAASVVGLMERAEPLPYMTYLDFLPGDPPMESGSAVNEE
jgi:hypothetical protein